MSVPLWMPALLCLLVLLFDLSTPPGIAAGVAYIPLVFCGLWFKRPHIAFVFAAIATALTAVGYFATAPTDVDARKVLVNRSLIIGAVWFVATLVHMRHGIEQTLRRNDNKLSVVINHAVDGLISIDEQGLIEHFNPASERIFGYGLAEVFGRNIEMLMSEPNHTEHGGGLLRYFSAREPPATGRLGCEVSAKRKDGSVFPMELTLSGFQLSDGRYVPGILRDISARKQVEERKALLAAIVASSDDAIISETLEGIITSWNVSAERLLGYSAEETNGKSASLIVPPERLEEEKQILERLGRGEEIHRLETTRLNKNGHRFSVSLTISPVRNSEGRIIGASKIMRDITAQKNAEAALLSHTRALERSNQELDDFAYIARPFARLLSARSLPPRRTHRRRSFRSAGLPFSQGRAVDRRSLRAAPSSDLWVKFSAPYRASTATMIRSDGRIAGFGRAIGSMSGTRAGGFTDFEAFCAARYSKSCNHPALLEGGSKGSHYKT